MKALVFLFIVSMMFGITDGYAAGSDDPPAASQSTGMFLANDMIRKKRFGDAVPVLENVLVSEPGNADAWNLLGYSLRKQKKYDMAEKRYLRALDINPRHVGALEYLGELYAETGRRKQAEDMLGRLKSACTAGCEEVSELQAAISGYQTN